jgi:hypothetical protein
VLVDFFDRDGLAEALITACREPQRFATVRRAARDTVMAEYDRAAVCEPAWLALIDDVMRS